MSESSFSQLKSHSSGKRKFLQDAPINDENNSLENQIYRELDELVKEGESRPTPFIVGASLSSPSLPRWGNESISAPVGLAHNSSSGSMGGIVTILAGADDDEIPNSHKSTRYFPSSSNNKNGGKSGNNSANSSHHNSASSFSNYLHPNSNNTTGSNHGSASNYSNLNVGGSNQGSSSSYSIYNSNGGSNNGSASSYNVFNINGGSNNGSANNFNNIHRQTSAPNSNNSSASSYNVFANQTPFVNQSNPHSNSGSSSSFNVINNSSTTSNSSSFNNIAPPSTPQIFNTSQQTHQQPVITINQPTQTPTPSQHFTPNSLLAILQKTADEQSQSQAHSQQITQQQQQQQQTQQMIQSNQNSNNNSINYLQQNSQHDSYSSIQSDSSRSSMSINNLINPDSVLLPPRSDFTLSPQSSQSMRTSSSNNSSMLLTNTTTSVTATSASNTSSVVSSLYSNSTHQSSNSNTSSMNMAIEYTSHQGAVGGRRPQTSTTNFMNSASLTTMLSGWVWVKNRQSILIIGPNGIGKSFLLNTILRSTFIPTASLSRPILGSHRGFGNDDDPTNSSKMNIESPTSTTSPMQSQEYSNYFLLNKLKNHLNQSPNQVNIDHRYHLDANFQQSVDWTKERELEMESMYKTSQYIHTKQFPTLNDNHTFLLPQGRLGPAQLFRFAYGAICELIVEFISETDLRQILWELHQYESDKSVPMNPRRLEFLTWTYASVVEGATASTSGRTINLITEAKNSWDLPLVENVKQLLGKTVQFKGTGKDHNIDRIYIREKLKETLACYGYITACFFFRLPCSILLGRREISILSDDTRRGNVSKFTATRMLNDAEQILLAFDYRGLSADVADLLIGSNFMQKLSNEGTVQFIELGEKFQNKTPYPKGIYNSKGLLITQLKKLYRNSRYPTNFDQVLNNFKLLQIMPLLFLSAELNKALPLEYASSIGSLKQLKDITNIPLLIKIIHQATHTSWTAQHHLFDRFKENVSKKTTLLHQYFKSQQTAQQKQPQSATTASSTISATTATSSTISQATSTTVISLTSSPSSKKPTTPTPTPMVSNPSSTSSSTSSSPSQKQPIFVAPRQTASTTPPIVVGPPKSPTQMIIDDTLSSSFKEQLQLSSTPTSAIRGNNWRSQYLQYKQVGPVPGSASGMDKISSSFRTRFAGWKRKLLAYVSSEASESVFLNKVAECESFARTEWERFRHHSPDYNATIADICSNLYGLSSGTKLASNNSVDFYNNTVGNPVILLCRTLLHWTPVFWRENVVERMPLLEQEIVQFTRSLLGDISNLLINKVNMPIEEKNQHIKLLQYCQSATERNIHNKMSHIQSFFIGQNMTQLFYAICLDAFCSELTSKATSDPKAIVRYHEMVEVCFHSAPLMAASKIQQKLLEMTRTALTYVDSIEKHLEHTMQYLLNSPFRIKRQMQLKPKIDFTLNVIDNYINLVDPIEDPTSPVKKLSNNKFNNSNLSPTSSTSSSSSSTSSSSPSSPSTNESRSPSPESSPNMLSSPSSPQDRMDVDDSSSNPPFNKRIKKPIDTSYTSESQGSIVYTLKTNSNPPQTPSPLLQLCIAKICQQIHALRCVSLPEELLQKVITLFITQETIKGAGPITTQLDDALLVRLMIPTLKSLDLEGAKNLTPLSIRAISATCPNLRKLSLAYCTGIPSDSLSAIGIGCKQLEVISLKGCHQLTNVGLLYLVRGCPNLNNVDLSGCMKLTDSAIHELHQTARRLQTLDLRRCVQLTDAAFQSFNLTTLLNIDLLECNSITDASIINICNTSRQLNSIKLSSKSITDQSLKRLSVKCKQLTTLELIGCENITDSGVQAVVRGCPDLTSVNLCSSKHLTTSAFQIDEDDNMMNTNDHNSNSSMDSLMAAAASTANELCLKNLKHLDLNRCMAINDSSILTLTMQATMIETISLAYCEDITDEAVITIAQRLNHLKNIDLSKCKHITDQSINELVKTRGPELNRLVLFSCTLVSDVSIVKVASICHALIHLDVSQCEKITDASLVKISQGMPLLKVLCMEECVITDVGVSLLGSVNECSGCPQLEVIKFGYCRFISDASLAKLSFGCPLIASVDLSYCSNLITPRGIRSAIKAWPRLHTLRLRGYNSLTNEDLLEATSTKLKTVNLSWCINLEDSSLIKFAKKCPSLENLDISRCPKITDSSLENIVDSCSSVRVNVSGCKEITSFTVQRLSSLGKSIYR